MILLTEMTSLRASSAKVIGVVLRVEEADEASVFILREQSREIMYMNDNLISASLRALHCTRLSGSCDSRSRHTSTKGAAGCVAVVAPQLHLKELHSKLEWTAGL